MERDSYHSNDVEIRELIAKVKDGDREAIELLLTRYRPLLLDNVRRLKAHLKGDVLGREDLEQEAAKIAIELIQEFEPGAVDRFGSYLKQKLRWRLINYVRRERNKMRRSVELDDDLRDNLAEELRLKDSLEVSNPRLRAAMKQLSPKQRSIIFKLYWQDQTTREVATELSVTHESVRTLLRRAEEKIKKSF